jgi:hypothetical protein
MLGHSMLNVVNGSDRARTAVDQKFTFASHLQWHNIHKTAGFIQLHWMSQYRTLLPHYTIKYL